MHWFQYWPSDHLQKFYTWSPDFVTGIATYCLGLSCWHYYLVLSWYLHQPESHQLSLQKVSQFVRDNRTHRSDQGYLGPIKIMSMSQKSCMAVMWDVYRFSPLRVSGQWSDEKGCKLSTIWRRRRLHRPFLRFHLSRFCSRCHGPRHGDEQVCDLYQLHYGPN